MRLPTCSNDASGKLMSTSTSEPPLSAPACIVRKSEGKGRGVYASRPIASQTVVESSPVLLFTKEEYEQHGRFTILDEYTFKWRNGSMALALGIGSLFNHSNSPNVSYTIDSSSDSIHYTTTREIQPDEELCIYYGANLWFEPVGQPTKESTMGEPETDDGWGGLSTVEPQGSRPMLSDDDIVPEEDLPFERFKPPPEEETAEEIRTVQAWAVAVPDPKNIGSMLKWLRRSELDASELGHLKRVRKQGEKSTFLLALSPTPPTLPEDITLSDPFLVTVPASVALTPTSLSLKSVLWPTIYAPRRKNEVEDWSQGKARWAQEAMHAVVQEALRGLDKGELPIAACIPAPYETMEGTPTAPAFFAHDTRQSTAHPLRHAVMNVIRQLADHRALSQDEPIQLPPSPPPPDGDSPRNGTNYLLTSQILFTTHEPCIMCSMALLHSRVKEVVYLLPMEKTGGCGGAACLPTLPGVNHRFSICRWKGGAHKGLRIDTSVDA
ncbi:cytidine deaminase-like protein [Mycena rebaudengoi]|nr:cytidine deaminase-like protein [Mycena rebaudengoi]